MWKIRGKPVVRDSGTSQRMKARLASARHSLLAHHSLLTKLHRQRRHRWLNKLYTGQHVLSNTPSGIQGGHASLPTGSTGSRMGRRRRADDHSRGSETTRRRILASPQHFTFNTRAGESFRQRRHDDTDMPPSLNVTTHSFTHCDAQASALAERIANRLRSALTEREHAVLAVSGGTTPKSFFDKLARQALDWARVQITLVDERWVPESDPRSNAHLVRTSLLHHAASAAAFTPLYTGAATPEEGIDEATARINALSLPFDAVVLGMGDDGHTASFFPEGDHLAEALDPDGAAPVLSMRAPTAAEPRITLSLSTLLNTRALYLLVTGEHKRQLLADARLGLGAAQHIPVRAVLTQERVPVAVYWCP